MRIPVVGNVSTKDGSSNKNARMTNLLDLFAASSNDRNVVAA